MTRMKDQFQTAQTNYFREWLNDQTKVRRLLLIDDSMEDCILIQRYTFIYHCEWVIANNYTNAEFALRKMSSLGGFSLIFLDMNLGGAENGVDVFIKVKDKWPDIPVVVLSGHLSAENISSVTKHGFAMFAQKPESFTEKYFSELFRIMNIPLRPQWQPGVDDESSSI